MKFTLGWLKEHLDTALDAPALAARLTAIGLEVEGIEDKARTLAPFTVAYVKSAERHPNADKLRVCTVETGRETLQVVCGAPNARAGMKGVFAPAGSVIPGTGQELKKGVIRGVESNGMLCSAREMGLSDEHEGIIELPADAPVGAAFAEVLGLGDPVIEIKLTPNRGDCNAVTGVARDLAAAGAGALKSLAVGPVKGAFGNPLPIGLEFPSEAASACPMFAGRWIRGVRNRPSPDWLQRRLTAVGLRPISALVDVTNYVSYDRARPLHVYDAAKIERRIFARLARAGETLAALDGKTYSLDPGMCVIADDGGVLGLAGVMGGAASGCTDATTDVFVESALFDPVRTARTGRLLGINSDARYRFERGVDPEFVAPGLELATRLILEICGGVPSGIEIAGAAPAWRRIIAFDPARVEKLTGVRLGASSVARILEQLGFACASDGERLSVAPPSWRPDVQSSADLVEEVIRIHGLDKMTAVPLPRSPETPRAVLTPAQLRVRGAKRALAARGLVEAMTWPFIPAEQAQLFGGSDPKLTLVNPIAADMNTMRPSLLPGLLAAAARNAARGQDGFALFEVGPQFTGGAPGEQIVVAAGLRFGAAARHWDRAATPAPVFAAKADALALLAALGGPAENAAASADAPGWYHPGRSGQLRLGPKNVLAAFGELHPRVLAAFEVEAPAAAFEVVLDSLPAAKAKASKAKAPLAASDYPAVERDFAFVLRAEVPAGDVLRAAGGADKALIERVSVFDVYEGKGVPEGHKSLAVAVRLQPRDRTLTEVEIETVSAKIVAAVTKATGGALRS